MSDSRPSEDAELVQLRARLGEAMRDIRYAQAAGRPIATAQLRGLRIQTRMYLDRCRGRLEREQAADLRGRLQDLDRLLASLPA